MKYISLIIGLVVLAASWGSQADIVALKSNVNNQYIKANNCADGDIIANATSLDDCSKFMRVYMGNGWYALQNLATKQYLSTRLDENGTNPPLKAKSASYGSWEKFQFSAATGTTTIKNEYCGWYMSAAQDGGTPGVTRVVVDRTSAGAWESWTVEVVSTADFIDDFNSFNSNYWTKDKDQNDPDAQACYTDASGNYDVSGGVLSLKVTNGSIDCNPYTSGSGTKSFSTGRITSKHKEAFAGGSWEARMKLSSRDFSGMAPYFILANSHVNWPPVTDTNFEAMSWPNSNGAKVTVFELPTRLRDVYSYGTDITHYEGANLDQAMTTPDQWHTYRVEFQGNDLVFKLDGSVIGTMAGAPDFTNLLGDAQFFAVIGLGYGENAKGTGLPGRGMGVPNGGWIDPATSYPQSLQIDYVKHEPSYAFGGGTAKISNGDFTTDMSSWGTYVDASASATFGIDTRHMKCTITNGSDAVWKVQMSQNIGSVTAGKKYRLQFWGYADQGGNARQIQATVDAGGTPDYHIIGGFAQNGEKNVTVYPLYAPGQTWNYDIEFTCTETHADARLCFNMGADNNNVWIDEVLMTEY